MKLHFLFLLVNLSILCLLVAADGTFGNSSDVSLRAKNQYFSDVFKNDTSGDQNSQIPPKPNTEQPSYSTTPGSNVTTDNSSDVCSSISNQPDPCNLSRTVCVDESIIKYSSMYFCAAPQYRWLIIVFMLVFLFLMFFILSHNSDIYLSPSIQQLADFFNVSDEVTGAVFLSFCNGAPDFFTALASSSNNSYDLILGNVLGAGLFELNVVMGFIVLGSIVYYNSFIESLAQFNSKAADLLKAKNSSRTASPFVKFWKRLRSKLFKSCSSTQSASSPVTVPLRRQVSSKNASIEGETSRDVKVSEDNAVLELDRELFNEIVNDETVQNDPTSDAANRMGIATAIHYRFVKHLVNPFQNILAAVFRNDLEFRGYAVNPTSYFRNLFVYMLAVVSIFLVYQFGVITLWMPILYLVAYATFMSFVLGQRWLHNLRKQRAAHEKKHQRSIIRTLTRNATRSRTATSNRGASRVPVTAFDTNVSATSSLGHGAVETLSSSLKHNEKTSRPSEANFVEEARALKETTFFISFRHLWWVTKTLLVGWKDEFLKESWTGKPFFILLSPLRFLCCITAAPAMVQLIDEGADDDDASGTAEIDDDVNAEIESEISRVEDMISSTEASEASSPRPSAAIALRDDGVSEHSSLSDTQSTIDPSNGNDPLGIELLDPAPGNGVSDMSTSAHSGAAKQMQPESDPTATKYGGKVSAPFSSSLPHTQIFGNLPSNNPYHDTAAPSEMQQLFHGKGTVSYSFGHPRNVPLPLELSNSLTSEERVFFASAQGTTPRALKSPSKHANSNSPPITIQKASAPAAFLEVPAGNSSLNSPSSVSPKAQSPQFLNWSTPSFSRSISRSPNRSVSAFSSKSTPRKTSAQPPRYSKGFVRFVYQMSQLEDWKLLLYRIRCATFPPFACIFALFATKNITTPLYAGSPIQLWVIMLPIGMCLSGLFFFISRDLRALGRAVRDLLELVPEETLDYSAKNSFGKSGAESSQIFVNSLARSRTLNWHRQQALPAVAEDRPDAATLHPKQSADVPRNGMLKSHNGASLFEIDSSTNNGNFGSLGGKMVQTETQSGERRVHRMLALVTVGSSLLKQDSVHSTPNFRQKESNSAAAYAAKNSKIKAPLPAQTSFQSFNAGMSASGPSPFLALRSMLGTGGSFTNSIFENRLSEEPEELQSADRNNNSNSLVSRALSKLKSTVGSSSALNDSTGKRSVNEESLPPENARKASLPNIVISTESPERDLTETVQTSNASLAPPRLVISSPQSAPEEHLETVRLASEPADLSGASGAEDFASNKRGPFDSLPQAFAEQSNADSWNLRVEPPPSVRSKTSSLDLSSSPSSNNPSGAVAINVEPSSPSLKPPACNQDIRKGLLEIPDASYPSLDKYTSTLSRKQTNVSLSRTISSTSAVQIFVTYNTLVKALKFFYYFEFFLNILTLTIVVLWIYVTANEVVALLLSLSHTLKLSEGLMGVSILAWGNTFGDLFANMAMAKAGNFHAAVTAAFTGPIMNVFLTIGLTFLIARIRAGANIPLNTFKAQQYFAFGFLMFGLIFFGMLVLILYYKLRMPKSYSLTLLAYYILFFIVICIAEAFI